MPIDPQARLDFFKKIINGQSQSHSRQLKDEAHSEFIKTKQQIISEETSKEDQNLTKLKEQFKIEMRISNSNKKNQSKLRIMTERADKLQLVKADIRKQLQQIISNQLQYKQLMTNLLVQGLIKLLQKQVQVGALPRDFKLLQQVLPAAKAKYLDLYQKELGRETQVNLRIKEKGMGKEYQDMVGGVVLTCQRGKIVCANTLKLRIELAYQESLPDIRRELFFK